MAGLVRDGRFLDASNSLNSLTNPVLLSHAVLLHPVVRWGLGIAVGLAREGLQGLSAHLFVLC